MNQPRPVNHWDEAVQQICGNFRTDIHRDIPFVGNIRLADHGGLEVAHIETNALRVQHHLQAAEDSRNCFLILQTSGVMGFSSLRGERLALKPGEIALIDSSRPFDMHPQGLVQQLSVHIPSTLLAEYPMTHQFGKLPDQGINSQMLRLMLQHLRFQKDRSGADQQEGTAICKALVSLLQPAINPADGHRRGSLREQAEQLIHNMLGDEHLNPDSLAQAMKISRRTLYRLFECEGDSIGRYILQQRLQQCRAELEYDGNDALSITDIAFRWGFSDASRFSRAFRRETGLSPRAYRRQYRIGYWQD